jgi:hypothetical protein
VYAQLDLFNDPNTEISKGNPYSYPGEELHKNCKKDFDAVTAIIEIFRGELVTGEMII